MRQAARDGVDIRKEQRRIAKSKGVTFAKAFDDFFEIRRQHLSNGKHVQQWQNTMRDYVLPIIGNRPVAEIAAGEVIDVLKPIWFEKAETAARVLQRIKATFDSAILRGTRERQIRASVLPKNLETCGVPQCITEHCRGVKFLLSFNHFVAAPHLRQRGCCLSF